MEPWRGKPADDRGGPATLQNGFRRLRADDGIRTRDPHLGKVMRYQLRYVRMPAIAGRCRPAWRGVREEL